MLGSKLFSLVTLSLYYFSPNNVNILHDHDELGQHIRSLSSRACLVQHICNQLSGVQQGGQWCDLTVDAFATVILRSAIVIMVSQWQCDDSTHHHRCRLPSC